MHVNTKELPTWALHSVWWSDRADAGPYAANRPSLPDAQGPWAFLLVESSAGVPVRPQGAQPVAMNPVRRTGDPSGGDELQQLPQPRRLAQ